MEEDIGRGRKKRREGGSERKEVNGESRMVGREWCL